MLTAGQSCYSSYGTDVLYRCLVQMSKALGLGRPFNCSTTVFTAGKRTTSQYCNAYANKTLHRDWTNHVAQLVLRETMAHLDVPTPTLIDISAPKLPYFPISAKTSEEQKPWFPIFAGREPPRSKGVASSMGCLAQKCICTCVEVYRTT